MQVGLGEVHFGESKGRLESWLWEMGVTVRVIEQHPLCCDRGTALASLPWLMQEPFQVFQVLSLPLFSLSKRGGRSDGLRRKLKGKSDDITSVFRVPRWRPCHGLRGPGIMSPHSLSDGPRPLPALSPLSLLHPHWALWCRVGRFSVTGSLLSEGLSSGCSLCLVCSLPCCPSPPANLSPNLAFSVRPLPWPCPPTHSGMPSPLYLALFWFFLTVSPVCIYHTHMFIVYSRELSTDRG